VQATHAPDKQTRFVPQPVPSWTDALVSVQVAVPAEQSSVPVWQGLVGTQGDPELHALHSPLLHTIPVPQALPLLALLLSMHAACPVLHEVCPTRQGAPVTSQVAPALQVRHVPWWQTLSVPHFAPSSRGAPRSVHTGTPPVHESVPWWQALVGTQPAPALQATHWPTEHTWPDPQGVPSSALPDSTHADTPVAQLVWPSLHAWLRLHGRPSTQVEQPPSAHSGPASGLSAIAWSRELSKGESELSNLGEVSNPGEVSTDSADSAPPSVEKGSTSEGGAAVSLWDGTSVPPAPLSLSVPFFQQVVVTGSQTYPPGQGRGSGPHLSVPFRGPEGPQPSTIVTAITRNPHRANSRIFCTRSSRHRVTEVHEIARPRCLAK
jgi:hypothetical protein